MSKTMQINLRPHNVSSDRIVVYNVWTGEKKQIVLTENYLSDKIPTCIQLFQMRYLLVISNCFLYDDKLTSLISFRADIFVIENGRAISAIVAYESEDETDSYKKLFCVSNHILYMVDEQNLYECSIGNLLNHSESENKLGIVWFKRHIFKSSVVPSALIACPGKKTRLVIIRDDDLVNYSPEEKLVHFPNKLPCKLHGIETYLHENHIYLTGKDFKDGSIHMYKIFIKCKFKVKRWIFERQLGTKKIFSTYAKNEMGKIIIDKDYSMRLYHAKNKYHLLTRSEKIARNFFKLLPSCDGDTIPVHSEDGSKRNLSPKQWIYRSKTLIKTIGAKRIMGKYLFYYNPKEEYPKIRKRQILTDLFIYFSNNNSNKYFTRKSKIHYLKALQQIEGLELNIEVSVDHMKRIVKKFNFK